MNDSASKQDAIQAAKSPEDIAREAAAKKAHSTRLDAAIEMVAGVKEHAKDPDSVKFSQIGVNSEATLVCGTYRAKNSFNAVVPGVMVIDGRKASFDQSVWNKKCSNNLSLVDYTYVSAGK